MSKRSNWDIHYNNRIRIFTTFIGLKGNFVLNKNIKNFIFKNSNGFNKILEIGAGSGRLSALVSKYFNQCDLIDKSSSALKLAAIISKKSRPIIIDIFDYSENEKYDVVVSVGLVEHFEKNKMQKLIEKHLKLAKQNGCVIIVVPAYSADREMLVKTPSMNKKYGFQDAKAEFKVEGYFIKRNISFDKINIDNIPTSKFYFKFLRYLNILTYKYFNLNLEIFFSHSRGAYSLFFINKELNESKFYK